MRLVGVIEHKVLVCDQENGRANGKIHPFLAKNHP
jgi:hypothetical protein